MEPKATESTPRKKSKENRASTPLSPRKKKKHLARSFDDYGFKDGILAASRSNAEIDAELLKADFKALKKEFVDQNVRFSAQNWLDLTELVAHAHHRCSPAFKRVIESDLAGALRKAATRAVTERVGLVGPCDAVDRLISDIATSDKASAPTVTVL